jgi:hypothetical protein
LNTMQTLKPLFLEWYEYFLMPSPREQKGTMNDFVTMNDTFVNSVPQKIETRILSEL